MNVVLAGLLVTLAALKPSFEPPVLKFTSETQRGAFEHGPTPMLLSGGWGAGKTWLGCKKGLYLSLEYPKNRGVIVRAVGKELRATTQATWYKGCPRHLYDPRLGGRRNDQEGKLILRNGSEVLFMHMDDPETAGIIRGLEINWFLIDQAEENPERMEEIFDLLLGRLGRWDIAEVPQWMQDQYREEHGREWPYRHPEKGTPVPPPYPMLTCNPDVETHWLYRRFHPESPEFHEKYAKEGYAFFDMPSEDNQFLGEINLKFLLAHDDAFIRRNVKGLWGMPEGAIHSIHPTSVLEGTPELEKYFREHCTLYRCMDYGDSAPTCVLWMAVDRNGNVFWFREYYMPNLVISKHRANITGLSTYEAYKGNYADPSIFHKMPAKESGTTIPARYCVADEYADVKDQPRSTAIFWTPADNNELGTRNRINEYLRFDPDRIHPITRQPGSARMFYVKQGPNYPHGVVHALRQTRNQRRVKIGTELGKPIFSDERDETVTDHAYDPVRYGTATRPPAPPAIAGYKDGTFAGVRKKAKEFRRQQQQRGRR